MSVTDRIAALTPEQRALFERLRERQREAPIRQLPPIARVTGPTGAGDWPLTFDQERLWFLSFLDPRSTAYNMLTATRLRGELDPAALEGALEERPLVVADGRSFTVPTLADDDIEEIYALRFLLEPEALRLAANARPARKALAPLRAALDDMASAHEAGDGAAFMDANYRYRDAWTDLVPNKRLVRAISLYADHVRYLRAFTLDNASVRAVVLKGLRQLTTALAAGDGDADGPSDAIAGDAARLRIEEDRAQDRNDDEGRGCPSQQQSEDQQERDRKDDLEERVGVDADHRDEGGNGSPQGLEGPRTEGGQRQSER